MQLKKLLIHAIIKNSDYKFVPKSSIEKNVVYKFRKTVKNVKIKLNIKVFHLFNKKYQNL